MVASLSGPASRRTGSSASSSPLGSVDISANRLTTSSSPKSAQSRAEMPIRCTYGSLAWSAGFALIRISMIYSVSDPGTWAHAFQQKRGRPPCGRRCGGRCLAPVRRDVGFRRSPRAGMTNSTRLHQFPIWDVPTRRVSRGSDTWAAASAVGIRPRYERLRMWRTRWGSPAPVLWLALFYECTVHSMRPPCDRRCGGRCLGCR